MSGPAQADEAAPEVASGPSIDELREQLELLELDLAFTHNEAVEYQESVKDLIWQLSYRLQQGDLETVALLIDRWRDG